MKTLFGQCRQIICVTVLVIIGFCGCKAMDSLIIHPLKKARQIHNYNEAQSKTNR